MLLAALLLLTYFAGSINFAIIVLRLLGKEDPRTQFSGNAGTTNVYRQEGRGWGAVVLLLAMWRAVPSFLIWVIVHRIVRIPFIASFFMILTLGAAVVAISGREAAPITATL